MPSSPLLLPVGLVLLLIGAHALVAGAAAIARRLGVSAVVIGLTIVAVGTSAPELFIAAEAALAGRGGIALGNAIGASIANLGLILGLTAVVSPLVVHSQLIRIDVPIMIFCTALLLAFLADGRLSRIEGMVLLLGNACYVAFSLWLARRTRDGWPAAAGRAAGKPGRAMRDVLLVLAGFALLAIGARLLIGGAVALATRLGVPDAVVALSIVSLGTTLPELVTSLVAAHRRQADVAVGNIVGSNLFNTLAVLGSASTLAPIEATGLRGPEVFVMLLLGVATLAAMRRGAVIARGEGALLLAVYLGYTAWLWHALS